MSTSSSSPIPASTIAMLNASKVSSAASSSSASASTALPANETISQAGFLQLISTQMQDQDPLDPTDPTQFLSQIEGLSEVSSLQGLQTSISGLSTGLQASQMLSGTSLLGHSVLAAGSTATIASGGTVTGAVTAPTGATGLTVAITDQSGALVNAFNVTPAASGNTSFSWNGTTSSGAAAPAGTYTVNVVAAVGNTTQQVSPMVYSTVNSVTIDPSTQTLNLNTTNGTIPLSSVVSID